MESPDNVAADSSPVSSVSSPSTSQPTAQDKMFSKIIANDSAFFKAQQRGEPDLSNCEKLSILAEVFSSRPTLFLSRYRHLLNAGDVQCFASVAEEPEVAFYLRELAGNSRERALKRVRNRRFEALRRLEADGSFFSDEEMRERDPLLYYQMVGRHLTEKERFAAFHCASDGTPREQTLTGIFVAFADNHRISEKRRGQEFNEHCEKVKAKMLKRQNPKADDESSSSEEDSEPDDEDESNENEVDDNGMSNARKSRLSDAEKSQLRTEFGSIMRDRFIEGADAEHFDYRAVDESSDYDRIDLIARDAEDSYFDTDDEGKGGAGETCDLQN